MPHRRHQRDVFVGIDMVGPHRFADLLQNGAEIVVFEVFIVDDHRHGIDPRGEMLEGDAVAAEHLQHLRGKADLRVHHGFFQQNDGEILFPRYARHDVVLPSSARRGHDQGAFVLGTEGVADTDGDTRAFDGKNRLAVQDVGAHIGKLAQLLIGKLVDTAGRADDPRIAGEKSADVRPVFI